MKQRLRQIIQYAAQGKPTAFAQSMGWSSQYMNKLLNTSAGIGLRPLVAILEHYPEIDARWLLLGTGTMLSDFSATLRQYLFLLLAMEYGLGDDMEHEDYRNLATEVRTSLARLEGYMEAVKKS